MEPRRISNPLPPSVAERGRFTWLGLALALLAAPAAGLICGWIGAMVQPYFSPLILFPVLLGVFAGLSIVGVVRFARIGNRPTIFLAALLAAAVAVAGQHGFSYLSAYYWTSPAVSPTSGRDLSALRRTGAKRCRVSVRPGPARTATGGRICRLRLDGLALLGR